MFCATEQDEHVASSLTSDDLTGRGGGVALADTRVAIVPADGT